MDKYQNKYRIPSARLQNWDYSSNGTYFITICTHNREYFFGKIVETPLMPPVQEMQLNDIGLLAEKFWLEIPNHFPFVSLGNFVIMPNHTHGILIIDKIPVEMPLMASAQSQSNEIRLMSQSNSLSNKTPLMASLPIRTIPINGGGITGDKNPMFHENISRIIRWYKGRCSFEIRKIHADFA